MATQNYEPLPSIDDIVDKYKEAIIMNPDQLIGLLDKLRDELKKHIVLSCYRRCTEVWNEIVKE